MRTQNSQKLDASYTEKRGPITTQIMDEGITAVKASLTDVKQVINDVEPAGARYQGVIWAYEKEAPSGAFLIVLNFNLPAHRAVILLVKLFGFRCLNHAFAFPRRF